MKTCNGCGAFFNKKCNYCGYEDSEWDEKDKQEFITLKITGNENVVNIKHGEPFNSNVSIKGDCQDVDIKALIINIIIKGNENQIRIDDKIRYTLTIDGDENYL